jgi:hypothetical protein
MLDVYEQMEATERPRALILCGDFWQGEKGGGWRGTEKEVKGFMGMYLISLASTSESKPY